MTCPYCQGQGTYTDPQLQVRCIRCFNPTTGTPGIPIGRMIDTEAPIIIRLADGTTKTYG